MKWKIIAWNVNGLRAVSKKEDLNAFLDKYKPHIFCMSETKLSCPFIDVENNLKEKVKGYKYRYWSPCLIKNGYSGTAIWTKKKPLKVSYGINNSELDNEGRVITLEFENFFVVHVYTPNSGRGLVRLNYRIKKWDVAYRNFIKNLQKSKPVIACGDFNVAHQEIDLANPKSNKKNSGFTKEERDSFSKLLKSCSLIDTFRYLKPDEKDIYSFWTYMANARAKNKGWRIDYFLLNESKKSWLKKSEIITDQMGSDHAPIYLELSI